MKNDPVTHLEKVFTMKERRPHFKYPGIRAALDGNSAVIQCERESSDGAGAYPITPSTQMGEYWAEAAANGHLNISGRPLIFIEPEGEHAAAAVTAGLSMTGLRAANFSSGQGIAYMHESLYAAVGKRLTYVLNIGARAMTKSTLNVHAGHDDYHCVDDTGFFQLFAANAQQSADLNIIAHRIAEYALTPGIVAQDGFLTTHLIESMLAPERELIAEYLGRPDDIIDTPTPAQKILYGDTRRRIPLLWDVDNPMMAGLVQNQDAYMQSVAAQRPFFFDHIKDITDQALDHFYQLTGRQYQRVMGYRMEDAEYVILGQGSVVPSAQSVADYLRETRHIKVGVVNMMMFRPFPGDQLGHLLKGKKGVAVLERLDQPLAADLPLMREVRAVLGKCLENGRVKMDRHGEPTSPLPHPELAVYGRIDDLPELYSGSFGMGSRDLQPEGLIAAVENMLPQGKHKRQFYLSIDFVHDTPYTPKQALYQDELLAQYPHLRELALHGSENPNLMPKGSITARFHSVGGWGAITTGKNMAMTLFDLLGYHIKANPKYGSEKKGQPTTYYLSAAPEPIRVNCEYFYVDVVLSPDPNVFHHTNALAGLKEGGVFIIQSELSKPLEVWASIPEQYQQIIVEKNIRVFYLDAFKIAREEATDPELQLRMQGIAFQGAFFASSPLMQQNGLNAGSLINAIRKQLEHKFASKGARVVEENIRVVKRGFDEVQEISEKAVGVTPVNLQNTYSEPPLPSLLKHLPQSQLATSDIHRFWEQTGNFYVRGKGNDNLSDPFISLGIMPASSSVFRDMTGIRFEHPEWNPQNCTACGKCYTVCPDTAIPGLVNEVGQVLDTVLELVRQRGHQPKFLPRAVRQLEPILRKQLNDCATTDPVDLQIQSAIDTCIAQSKLTSEESKELHAEFDLFKQELGDFRFALSTPYYSLPEKQQAGSGGLLSITVNPYTCKGCMACVEVCNDNALVPVRQTEQSVNRLRKEWDLWESLPTTPERYIRVQDLEQGIGALETILLDKRVYQAFSSGDGACLGCSEKTAIHLFTATVEALTLPRVKKHVAYLTDLIQRLEQHVQMKLVHGIDVDDTGLMTRALAETSSEVELTLADIATRMKEMTGGEVLDREWLQHVNQLIAKLKDLRWRYTEGTTGRGRAAMGILNATGCSSVWGSTYPYNPYPFPWANHLFQDSASMAMGVFEGHMARMAEGFKAIRMAELELAGRCKPQEQREQFSHFSWREFTDDELHLCPPVVTVGGDGAMYDIGFQNLSRALMSGKPIKVLVLDTQVYSNTGGQACTSGFMGQISDMAQYGKAQKGKQETRKELGLIAMAHRTSYVMQSTIAQPNHMIEGFIQGLMTPRPALFNIYTACQPEHGIGDDKGHYQAKLAVESRAYPIFRYNPDLGKTVQQCLDLDGNPAMGEIWPSYDLRYQEAGREKTMKLPVTFADFAMTEGRFRKHFRIAPPDTWHDNMVPLADFIDLPVDEREDKYPFVWTVDKKQQLSRLIVASPMVASCEERRDFWILLRDLTGEGQSHPAARGADEQAITQQIIANITAGLMKLANNSASTESLSTAGVLQAQSSSTTEQTVSRQESGEQALAPWLDTEGCTTCGECLNINDKIFAYNEDNKAYIKNPHGGPYRDLVKAAEKCTAGVIHPGLPENHNEKDIDKWIARGSKFN